MTDTRTSALTQFRRPRWRPEVPALWRTRSSVQFGDDVIVDGITPAHVTWLASLDGLRTADQIRDQLPIDRADAHRLLEALAAAGGLVDTAQMPDVARVAHRNREGILGDLEVAMDTYRHAPAALAALANRASMRVAVVGGTPFASAVTRIATDGRFALADDPSTADVVVLADGVHPDVPKHLDPALGNRCYLHVGIAAARAVVGPLVVPGRTGCLRCAHLHRRDADPAWPAIAVQLAQAADRITDRAVDPLLAHAAAVHALLLVRTWIDNPDDANAWADLAVEIRLPGPAATRVARPPHPLCGCMWPQD